MSEDRTTVSVSNLTRNQLKRMRKMNQNGDMETIEEVIIRISRKSGIDLKGRKIGLDKPE